MTRVLEITDLKGRNVYLTKERWSHIQKHPEMINSTEKIRETLEKPDKTESAENLVFYFKHYKDRKQYLFVSVKYLNEEGFIITSFYTDKPK